MVLPEEKLVLDLLKHSMVCQAILLIGVVELRPSLDLMFSVALSNQGINYAK